MFRGQHKTVNDTPVKSPVVKIINNTTVSMSELSYLFADKVEGRMDIVCRHKVLSEVIVLQMPRLIYPAVTFNFVKGADEIGVLRIGNNIAGAYALGLAIDFLVGAHEDHMVTVSPLYFLHVHLLSPLFLGIIMGVSIPVSRSR